MLAEVLDELGLERAAVVGCSVGAFIGAELATRTPLRVSGVALVEFAFRDPEWWRASWTGVCRLFSVAVQSRSEIAARLERDVDDELVEHWNRDRSFAGVRHMIGVMWAIRSFDMSSALRSLQVPALVVFGGSGPTLECRPAVEAVLPEGARVEVLAGAGHFVTIDQPVAFAAIVGEFIAPGPPELPARSLRDAMTAGCSMGSVSSTSPDQTPVPILPEWSRELVEMLDTEAIAERIVGEGLRSAFPAHLSDAEFIDTFRAGVRENTGTLQRYLTGQVKLDDIVPARPLKLAALQARLDIPESAIQHSYRIGTQVMISEWTRNISARADTGDISTAQALSAVESSRWR